MSDTDISSLHFSVDVGLLFQLGEQLVTRRSIALAELVKNGYDADATLVSIIFQNIKTQGGSILIEDNGSGMTLDVFRNFWMTIATNHKQIERFSPTYNRPRTGAKGIGRFAARKLAHKLTIESTSLYSDGVKRRIFISFDWKKDFQAGKTLTSIDVPFEIYEEDDNKPTGTVLLLENLQDTWSEDDIIELQRELFTIVTPFSKSDVNSNEFRLIIQVPEYQSYSGELGERFLDLAWATLTGQVTTEGKAHYQLTIREPRQEHTYTVDLRDYPRLREANFIIYFMVYRKEYFAETGFKVNDAQRRGREQGGIRVYLDGFRVFPYGEPEDDWLQLNEIRARRTARPIYDAEDLLELESIAGSRPELLTPGNNQVFGSVNISQGKQSDIQISIGRERLLENEGFSELRDWVLRGIWWMTLHYARVTLKDRVERRKTNRQSSEYYDEIRSTIQESIAQGDISAQMAETVTNFIGKIEISQRQEKEELLNQLQILRILSAAGTAVVLTQHQLQALVNKILGISQDLDFIASNIQPDYQNEVITSSQELRKWYQSAQDQINLFGLLIGGGKRKNKNEQLLKPLVQDIINSLSYWSRDKNVQITNVIPKNLRTPPVHSAAITAVVLHVFTNALKAVRNMHERKIEFDGIRENGWIHLYVKDTGVGVTPTEREYVFEPFVSFSDPDLQLGIGSGLGLAVVRDLLGEYHGIAKFIDAPEGWVTCFQISLPEV